MFFSKINPHVPNADFDSAARGPHRHPTDPLPVAWGGGAAGVTSLGGGGLGDGRRSAHPSSGDPRGPAPPPPSHPLTRGQAAGWLADMTPVFLQVSTRWGHIETWGNTVGRLRAWAKDTATGFLSVTC